MRQLKQIFALLFALLPWTSAYAEYPNGVNGHIIGFGGWRFSTGVQTEVDAMWVVPTIAYDTTVAATGEQLFQWVGIAGINGAGKLAQVGIIQFFASGNGVETLYPFWECFGSNNIQMIAQPVAHGDVVFAKVLCTASCTSGNVAQKWTLTIQNITQNWTFNQTNQTCATLLDAAYVGGLENVNNGPIPKPNTDGKIEFYNIHSNDAQPTMTTAQGMYHYTTGSGATLNMSNPNGTNDGFLACWGDDGLGVQTGPYEPCTYPATTNNPGRSFRFGF